MVRPQTLFLLCCFLAIPLHGAHGARLKVVSFNTWLLRPQEGMDLAEDIDERAERMPQALQATGADVFALQEVWSEPLRNDLIRAMRLRGFPYHYSSPRLHAAESTLLRGAYGDGLLLISRYPLSATAHLTFEGHTRADEFLVAKGALHAVVRVPGFGDVSVFNSHAGAATHGAREEEAVRDDHLRQLIAWVRSTRIAEAPHIIAVDANTHMFRWDDASGAWSSRLSPGYQTLTGPGGLSRIDTFLAANGLSAGEYRRNPTYTYSAANPYVAGGYFGDDPPSRIDYIFIDRSSIDAGAARIRSSRIALDEAPHLSDHSGVFADFELSP